MSTQNKKEKWVIIDSDGNRYGDIKNSKAEAETELPKLQESSGQKTLSIKQILTE